MREYRSFRRLRTQARVIRRMALPALPRRSSAEKDAVWGVSVVRDELDVLPSVIDHLLAQGLDRLLIADNGSRDGTREWLQQRAERDHRLLVALDGEPAHVQSEKITWLAHRAWRAGAGWLVPFDADEFWFAERGSVAEHLRAATAGIVHATFHHMVPVEADPIELRTAEFMMDTASSVPGKIAVRAHPLAVIGPGNHRAARTGGEAHGLRIAHAQYRGPSQIARKMRQGAAAAALTGEDLGWFSPHWVKGAELDDLEIRSVFERISRGEPDARIRYAATGPMARVRPLLWTVWDEDGAIAAARTGAGDAAE